MAPTLAAPGLFTRDKPGSGDSSMKSSDVHSCFRLYKFVVIISLSFQPFF